MYVSSSREILLQCWNLHIRCRATVSSRVSRDCMLGYFGFFFCISSTLCCCCWSLLCWYGEECRVDQRKVNSLPCLFVRLNLCFSSLRWAPHTLSTQISSFTWYFFLFLFFFEYAIKLFKSSTIKPQFFTSSSNARNFLCWAQTSEKSYQL